LRNELGHLADTSNLQLLPPRELNYKQLVHTPWQVWYHSVDLVGSLVQNTLLYENHQECIAMPLQGTRYDVVYLATRVFEMHNVQYQTKWVHADEWLNTSSCKAEGITASWQQIHHLVVWVCVLETAVARRFC